MNNWTFSPFIIAGRHLIPMDDPE
jgi:hypothetical protein